MKNANVLPLLILILSLGLASCVGMQGPRTVTWYDEVILQSGETMNLERKTHEGPVMLQTGHGATLQEDITFRWRGKSISYQWRNEPSRGHLLGFDVVDGAPVIALVIIGAELCKQYGYPATGLVVFRYEDGKWSRISAPPSTLRVNLAVSYPWQGDKVSMREKQPSPLGYRDTHHYGLLV